MSYDELTVLCAAQAGAAIIGILWGVKRIHDMEKAAREMARGMTQLNTWDVDARIERLEGFREMVFRVNTKLGELENRLSDHIKVFDGHARHNDDTNNVWSATTNDLRRDMKELRAEKESLRKLTEGTSIRITHAEAKLTAVADAVRELTPCASELTAKVATLETQFEQLDANCEHVTNCEHVPGLLGRVGQLELDMPRLQKQVEAIDIDKLHRHITSEIARMDEQTTSINSRQYSLENDFSRETKQLDDRISGAYKAAQEAHAAAASVGSELEKVRRLGTVSPEVADGFSHRLARLENRVAALRPDGYLATKGEVQKMATELSCSIADGMEKEGKALWAHITQLHQDVSNLQQQMRQPSATQAPLKASRPIDDLAKEMLKQQQDQYIVVPADMGPTIEKMFSGPEVTEAIGKELGWTDRDIDVDQRLMFLEKLVKNDVENLCQLEKKVNDICKNVRHKADEDTLLGHFDARIKGLSKRVDNVEGKLPSGDESDDPDRETPFDCMSRRIDRALDRIQKLEVKRQEDDNQLDCVYKQIDSLGERVRNIEKQSESSRPTQTALAPKNNEFIVFPGDHPDQSFVVPADNIEAVAEARRKDMWRSLVEIKKLAQTTKDNERHLSRDGEDRMDHIVAVTDGLLHRLGDESVALSDVKKPSEDPLTVARGRVFDLRLGLLRIKIAMQQVPCNQNEVLSICDTLLSSTKDKE